MNKERTEIAGPGEPPFSGTFTTGYQRDLEVARRHIRARRAGRALPIGENPRAASDRRHGAGKRRFLVVAMLAVGAAVFVSRIEPTDVDPPPVIGAIAATDPISASFVRDFQREPVPTRPATRESLDDDVLYEALNRANWTDDEQMKQVVEGQAR